MNAPVTRRTLLGATAAAGALTLPVPAGADAMRPAERAPDPDAALVALIARWAPLRAAYDAAGERLVPLWETYANVEPERPTALHHRAGDGLGCGFEVEIRPDGRRLRLYGFGEVGKLMAPGWSTLCEAAHRRREEVVAAHHAWLAACRAVKDGMGLTALEDPEDEAYLALSEVERAIVEAAPATFAGLVAKVRWATGADMPVGLHEKWLGGIAADVLALAERGGAS